MLEGERKSDHHYFHHCLVCAVNIVCVHSVHVYMKSNQKALKGNSGCIILLRGLSSALSMLQKSKVNPLHILITLLTLIYNISKLPLRVGLTVICTV